MNIKTITNPDRKITQTALHFQLRFMEFTAEELQSQEDRYGSLPFGYVIGYNESEMVGVINLLKRSIVFNGRPIVVGGFGGVCTHHNFRRQGIASELLVEGMKILKDERCDIAFLNADIKRHLSLYSPVGFVPLHRAYKATAASGKIYVEKNGMIAPVCSPEVFNLVVESSEVFDLQGQDW